MKILLLGFLLAFAAGTPIPEEDGGGPVEVIVNGLPEGEPLEIQDIVDITLNHHKDGELAWYYNLLHPFTALGLAEAAAAAEAAEPVNPESPVPEPTLPEVNPEIPDSVVLPEPALPEVVPETPDSVVLPEPALPEVAPEIPDSITLPEPAVPEVAPEIPDAVVLPEPALPEVVLPEPEDVMPEVPVPEETLPAPAPQFPNGEIYNDGLVQVQVNAPEDPGVFATLQSWLSMALNYIQNGVQTTHQII